MYTPNYTKQFKKDIKNCRKEGKNIENLKIILTQLLKGGKIERKYRLHKLSGILKSRLECHIEPDWLLIFKKENNILRFERTGSHSKLFK